MPKRSNQFQKLVFLIKQHVSEDAKVTESKLLKNRLTGQEREVDICIESTMASHPVTISIECTDRKRRADVTWVEQMRAKHEDLPSDVLVLVSKSGFTPRAEQTARKRGIEILAVEQVDQDSADRLFGVLEALWCKVPTLFPEKVVVRVKETSAFKSEDVCALPDNIVFDSDGKALGTAKDLVHSWLNSPPVIEWIPAHIEQSHRSFCVEGGSPRHAQGGRLYLRHEATSMLRELESIRISGRCSLAASQFPLEHGILGDLRVSWGKGTFAGENAFLVASEDGEGKKRVSVATETGELRLSMDDCRLE